MTFPPHGRLVPNLPTRRLSVQGRPPDQTVGILFKTCPTAPAALRYSPRSAVLGPMHAWRGPHSAEVAMLRPYFPYRSFVVTIPNEAQVTMRKTRVWI